MRIRVLYRSVCTAHELLKSNITGQQLRPHRQRVVAKSKFMLPDVSNVVVLTVCVLLSFQNHHFIECIVICCGRLQQWVNL